MKLDGLFLKKKMIKIFWKILVIDNYKNLYNPCNPYYEINTLLKIYKIFNL